MSPVSRRTFLVAPLLLTAGASIAGCTTPPAPVLIDPEREALEAALAIEQRLLAGAGRWTDQAVVSQAEVTDVLQVHVDRLISTLGTTATPTSTDNVVKPVTTAELRQTAQQAVVSHTRASRTAGPQTAQLLASLAASDAAIAAALSEST